MIRGLFIGNSPWIEVVIGWGQSVRKPLAILDTGFSGDLQVTPQIARELNLQIYGAIKTQIANGQVVSVPIALAVTSMEGVKKYIEVLIADSVPLVGISFLTKFSYKALAFFILVAFHTIFSLHWKGLCLSEKRSCSPLSWRRII
jgi:predicted aspartyl protease